jgi:hypothetical protein
MKYPVDKKYYIRKKPELLKKFDEACELWKPVIIKAYHEEFAGGILWEARQEFQALIPQMPYIGGDENHYTKYFIESVRYLALYKAMKKHGRTAEETGKILYDAILTRLGKPRPPVPPEENLTREQRNERTKKGGEKSQERRYPGDYVYKFVAGDGTKFDRGLDFTECASLKFYHSQGAGEFLPFYCYLDYPASRVAGEGFFRTLTMADGDKICNHRFKSGRVTRLVWPPPFLKQGVKK